jgi:hypothetical protein
VKPENKSADEYLMDPTGLHRRFVLRRVLATAAVLFLVCGHSAGAATVVTVSGRQILLNGEPLIVRGVCYQPTPVGENPSQAAPWGDYYTLNYRAIYERDLPNLRRMGANVVRVYSWDPGASHSDFLNKAYNNNRNSLYVLVNRWIDPNSDWSNPGVVEAIKSDYRALAANVGAHPAVLGFIIGNELNRVNGANSNFWNAVNDIAAAIKSVAPQRLVTTSTAEGLSEIAQVNSRMTSLDAWSVQSYRGSSFGNLFSTYQAASSKPLLITEFGIDALDNRNGQPFANNALAVADWTQNLWREIRTNQGIVSGGCVFSYSDEWWKAAGAANVQGNGGHSNLLLLDTFSNEEWYGIFAVQDNGVNPDVLQPRALFSRLEALWATPAVAVSGAAVNGRLKSVFRRPADRDDLRFELEASSDTRTWTIIARSDRGGFTQSINGGALSIIETPSGTDRIVSVINAAATTPCYNRLRVTRY